MKKNKEPKVLWVCLLDLLIEGGPALIIVIIYTLYKIFT